MEVFPERNFQNGKMFLERKFCRDAPRVSDKAEGLI